MPEGAYITCECGYELFVPAQNIGSVQDCINCGHPIDTHPRGVAPEKDSVHQEHVVPLESPSPFDTRQSEFSNSESKSPFEDDDDADTGSPFDARTESVVDREPGATPSLEGRNQGGVDPRPDYAASIFEDVDEQVQDRADNPPPDPALLRQYRDPEHKAAYQSTTDQEKCPRCGNLFRGDWDQQKIGDETICYICSNQATDGMPDRLKEENVVVPNADLESRDWSGSVNVEIPEGPIEEKFWLYNPESRELRIMLYVLAFGTIFITAFVFMFTDSEPRVPSEGVVSAEPLPELPPWAVGVYYALQIFFAFIGQFFAFYLVLKLTDRLPHDHFGRDALLISGTMFMLGIFTALWFILAATIGQTLMGPVLMIMANVICMIPCILIVIHMLDFRIRDFLYLMFMTVFAQSMTGLISMFFYGALGAIAL